LIKVTNLTNGHSCPNIKTNIFPDKTSQVWKLPQEVLGNIHPLSPKYEYKITWHFESEAEIMHIFQLFDLLRITGKVVELFIPYFPYARQDKAISNETTFAQNSFFTHVLAGHPVTVFDIHNPSICATNNIYNITPEKFIVKSMIDAKTDLICYPDKGAAKRYTELADFIVADKVRDQLTGKITGHELLESNHSLEGKTILVVDDLCDGGATFISVCKMLKEKGASNVDLYVSHGVFSNGVHVLKHAGIRNIYTTDSFIGSSQMSKSMCTIYNIAE
jgi:ribose-phosphate pyrophosphokinase